MNSKKVRKKKIRKMENKLDNEAMMEENISTFGSIGLALTFICLGAMLGYILYKLAMNSSAIIVGSRVLF